MFTTSQYDTNTNNRIFVFLKLSFFVSLSYKMKRFKGGTIKKFIDEWTEKYLFIMVNDQLTCLVCHTVVTMMKKYNLERHYQSCHGHYEAQQNRREIVHELM
jgi:nitrate/TMAO reductase-like tetraheme cytochrome c subunit